MRIELIEAVWLEENGDLSLDEVVQLSGLPAEVLEELVNSGVLAPISSSEPQWRFTAACITTVRTAGRLRTDFDLDANALALVLRLMDRIDELEAQVRALRAGASS